MVTEAVPCGLGMNVKKLPRRPGAKPIRFGRLISAAACGTPRALEACGVRIQLKLPSP